LAELEQQHTELSEQLKVSWFGLEARTWPPSRRGPRRPRKSIVHFAFCGFFPGKHKSAAGTELQWTIVHLFDNEASCDVVDRWDEWEAARVVAAFGPAAPGALTISISPDGEQVVTLLGKDSVVVTAAVVIKRPICGHGLRLTLDRRAGGEGGDAVTDAAAMSLGLRVGLGGQPSEYLEIVDVLLPPWSAVA